MARTKGGSVAVLVVEARRYLEDARQATESWAAALAAIGQGYASLAIAEALRELTDTLARAADRAEGASR